MTPPASAGTAADLPADSDYTRFAPQVAVWASPAEFLSAQSWAEGVHVVWLPSGAHVDVLIRGDMQAIAPGRALLVVFSGAVSKRDAQPGPFFSGSGLGTSLETPFVAISDPSFTVDRNLRLGWYAGRAGEGVQALLVELLTELQRRAGRELLLAGGSGGAFAALLLGSQLTVPASAMVWNPQTDLLDYVPDVVAEYLALALSLRPAEVAGMSRVERSAALGAGGVLHAVPPNQAGKGLRRLLFLQNAADWHVVSHLAPYLEADGYQHDGGGRWHNARGHLVLVSAFGEGHDPPPRAAMVRALALLLDPEVGVDEVVDRLQDERIVSRTDLEILPRDLRQEVADVEANVGLTATVDQDGVVKTALAWNSRAMRYAGVSTVFELLDGDDRVLASHARRDNMLQLPGMGPELARVRVQVRDGFMNPVLTLTEPVTRVTRPLRVLVVGSCVSRDTFEFLRPEYFTLRGYVARQSLVSGFGPAGEPHFDLSGLPSAFQRRMLEGDARSSLPSVVAELADEVDLVLWDLVDERLGLLDHEDGTVSTDSVELRQAQLDGQAPTEPSGPAFGSPEHLARFTAVLPRWRALLEEHGLRSRTVLLAPPWATTTTTDEPTPASFGLEADRANELTRRYLDAVAAEVPVPVLGRDLTEVRGRADHQWGKAPFHYDDRTYLALAEQVARAAQQLSLPEHWETSSPSEMTRVPDPEARDPRRRAAAPEVVVEQTGPLELSTTIHGAGRQAVSFALHQGAQRVDVTPYARATTHRFIVPKPGVYRCRVFVMADDGSRVPVVSPPIRVS
ncbi:DUF6270 domain-containing protein [Pedococcus soli]